jgi:hypothetical protein
MLRILGAGKLPELFAKTLQRAGADARPDGEAPTTSSTSERRSKPPGSSSNARRRISSTSPAKKPFAA